MEYAWEQIWEEASQLNPFSIFLSTSTYCDELLGSDLDV